MIAVLRTRLSRLISSATLVTTLVAPVAVQAATVYDNSATDTLITYLYSATGATRIGDLVTLAGTDRILTGVAVPFFNAGNSGSFDAQLDVYAGGAPVGGLLGTASATGNAIGGLDILTVIFSGLNFLVPDTMAFAVSVSNVTSGLDLGLNAFEPPSVGASNTSQILLDSGAGLATGSTAAGEGNLYFVAMARPVPEPSAALLATAGLLAVVGGARRTRRRSVVGTGA
jgi:hypothetical protein